MGAKEPYEILAVYEDEKDAKSKMIVFRDARGTELYTIYRDDEEKN